MSFEDILFAIPQLTVEERRRLMEFLFESCFADDRVELSQWHRELIDERLAAAEANPGAGKPWREVLDRLMNKYGSSS
jgi:putative addiction module component (TIGR02574 family)